MLDFPGGSDGKESTCNARDLGLIPGLQRSPGALNMPANLENSAVATGLQKGQFSFQSQRKAMPKNAQTTAQLHSSHTLVK